MLRTRIFNFLGARQTLAAAFLIDVLAALGAAAAGRARRFGLFLAAVCCGGAGQVAVISPPIASSLPVQPDTLEASPPPSPIASCLPAGAVDGGPTGVHA